MAMARQKSASCVTDSQGEGFAGSMGAARQIAADVGKGFGQGWSVVKSYLASEGAFRAINNVA